MKAIIHSLFILLSVPSHFAMAKENTPEEEKKEIAAKPVAARGGGLGSFASVMGNMSLMNPTSPVIVYGGQWAPENSAPDVTQQRLNVMLPVYQDADDKLALSLSGGTLHFGEKIPLSKNNIVLPQDFYRMELGAQYSHTLEKERNWGLRGSLGYATDKPFTDSKDISFSLNASYSYPGKSGHWILFLYMANNGSLPNYVPIPGFIYFYKTEKFVGMFGLPLISMQWAPVLPWTFSFSAFGPTITTEVAYNLKETTQLFTGVNWSQQSFMRDGREKSDDRLFLDEKRAYLGVRAPLFLAIMSDLQVGYNFDRSVYEGEGFLNKERGSRDLKDSWSLAWNFRYVF